MMSIRRRRQTITRSTTRKQSKKEKEAEQQEKEGLLAKLAKKEVEELVEELRLAKEGTHPLIEEKMAEFNEKTEESLDRLEASYSLSMTRIEEEYETRMAKIRETTQLKMDELRETMLKDLEALERRTEIDYSCTEINKPTTSSAVDVNKKTLRGRGGVLIEPPTYFNATPKTSIISVHSNAQFLLMDSIINEDLELISSSGHQRVHRIFEVQLQKMKFMYDGKVYKQGEEMFVENSEYGKIPAKAEIVTESVVSFKASQAWDIRQIHASCSDLAEGRVKVYKKKNN